MSRSTSIIGVGSLLIAFVAVVGCRDDQPLAPDASGVSPSAKETPSSPAHVEGEIGPGANYELDLPAHWNGRLIAFAHGYRNPMDPVQEDPSAQVSAIRDALLPKGFGFAWTSYSENGFAVASGCTSSAGSGTRTSESPTERIWWVNRWALSSLCSSPRSIPESTMGRCLTAG